MKHCCVQRQYFFCIKKCGVQGCKICKPPRLPSIVCAKLSFFPDPLKKSASNSYQDFSDIWGKNTSEKDRPSLASSKKGKEKVKILFRISAETVCDILICDVCLKPRCVYSRRRLTKSECTQLQCYKVDHLYNCGGVIIPEKCEL